MVPRLANAERSAGAGKRADLPPAPDAGMLPLEDDSERERDEPPRVRVRENVVEPHLGERAAELEELEHVAEVRQHGMIVAIELARGGDRRSPFAWQERRGLRVYRHGLEREALLRPIGNVVYFMPPYVIEPDQIDRLVVTARDGIRAATCD